MRLGQLLACLAEVEGLGQVADGRGCVLVVKRAAKAAGHFQTFSSSH